MRRSRTGAEVGRGFRSTRRRGSRGLLVACLAPIVVEAAPTCATPPGFEATGRVGSSDVTVRFRTVPAAVEAGRHVRVEALVRARTPAAAAPTLRVDAQMPEHRHGTDHRARVVRGAGGVDVAEGLRFHMPGRWIHADGEQLPRPPRLSEAEIGDLVAFLGTLPAPEATAPPGPPPRRGVRALAAHHDCG